MTRPYPMEMRTRAMKFAEAGESCHQVVARLGVVASTVIDWLAQYRRTGSVAPGKMRGHRPKKIVGEYRDWALLRMTAGDYTLQGLADELEREMGFKVYYKTMWTFVHMQDQSFKNTSRKRTAKA
jgi:putative transposase